MSMRKRRGVIISTELILILAAVIILTFIAALGLSRTVMNQATSSKDTISFTSAHVWAITSGSSCKELLVQVYVTNLGSKPVVVDKIMLQLAPKGWGSWKQYNISVSQNFNTINPGETKGVSGIVKPNLNCNDYSKTVIVTIQYHLEGENSASRTLTVSKPVPIDMVGG